MPGSLLALRASFTLVAALYIAAADAGNLCHFPLAVGLVAGKAVAQQDYLPFLVCQYCVHGIAQPADHLPLTQLLRQIFVIADHIDQGDRRTVAAGIDIIRQRYILGAFSLAAKVHQDLICYPIANASFHKKRGASA